jgi:hypothetical protein
MLRHKLHFKELSKETEEGIFSGFPGRSHTTRLTFR